MRDPLIVRVYLIWFLFLICEAIVPITGTYADSIYEVYLYIALFLTALGLGVVLGLPIKLKLSRKTYNANKVVIILSVLTILGTLLVAFNRIFVQGIDYFQGISIAREQWKQASENIGTSLFGPFGNLLLAGFLYVHILLILMRENLTKNTVIFGFIAGLIGLMSEMIFTGGRSFLIIYIAAIYSAMLTRKKLGLPSIINPVYMVIFVSIAIFYAGYIFQLRAEMGGFSASDYTLKWIEQLGGNRYPNIPEWLDFPATHLGLLVISYIIHSIWIFQHVVSLDLHENFALFTFIRFMGFKAGILPEPLTWELSGYFMPIPGLIFHDFGASGIPVVAFILGLTYSVIRNIFLVSKGIGSLFLYTLMSTILILSPIYFAFDLMLFFYLLLYLIILKTFRAF